MWTELHRSLFSWANGIHIDSLVVGKLLSLFTSNLQGVAENTSLVTQYSPYFVCVALGYLSSEPRILFFSLAC